MYNALKKKCERNLEAKEKGQKLEILNQKKQ